MHFYNIPTAMNRNVVKINKLKKKNEYNLYYIYYFIIS